MVPCDDLMKSDVKVSMLLSPLARGPNKSLDRHSVERSISRSSAA